ncbi:sulfur carrier protein ThiS [Clostridium sp. 'deep sea']|uniref:sulfur carrier protein ThiS n=1 Tax=Clostridium sp. 'deep sea' TaxID=2779445 RepID=UPI001896932A|nr:sulfur carrier protein ThiS [Clostridium sp. 'deep sea']QOR36744.1 sulfur carrier protein ThiS [Clostridium sp. 'deep sea']
MIVNGKAMKINNITIAQLLTKLQLSQNKVVVEVNLQIIAKQHYDSYKLKQEDKIEIISFVGGG